MKNTIKALSKQFFGAKYESARKSLLAAVILFIAVYAAEFRVEIAPFILYLTSTFFTAGIMWQLITGRRHMEAMLGTFTYRAVSSKLNRGGSRAPGRPPHRGSLRAAPTAWGCGRGGVPW